MKTKSLAKWLKGAAYVATGGVLLYSAVAILTSVVSLVLALAIGTAAWAFAPVYLELLAYGQATAMLSIFKGDPVYGLRRIKRDMIEEFGQRKAAVLKLGEAVNFSEQGLHEMRRVSPGDVAMFEATLAKQRVAYEMQLGLLDQAQKAIGAFDTVIDRAKIIYDQHQRMNKSLGIINMLNGGTRAEMRQQIESTALTAIQDEVAKSMAQLDMAMRGDGMAFTKATNAELDAKKNAGVEKYTTGQRHDAASMAAMKDMTFELDEMGNLVIESIELDAPLKKNVKFEILAIEANGRQSIAFTGEIRAGLTHLTPDVLNIYPRQRVHNDVKTKYYFVAQDPAFIPREAGMRIGLDVSPAVEQKSPYDRLG